MKNKRPVNLNLFTIHFPIPAIVSILHRISGLILFFMIPFFLWGLDLSLSSTESFDSLAQTLSSPLARFITWVLLSSFIYHFVAGIRHLLMDLHWGEELKGGIATAWVTMVVAILLIILAGIWLW